MPTMLPRRAVPKMRSAWEYGTLICCGEFITARIEDLAICCTRCGIARRLGDLDKWDRELTPLRIAAERYYQEKRGHICLDTTT